MRKKVGIIKRVSCIGLIFLLSINSFAAIVSDNDGSAFITKAEFDALKSSFQSQIDTYNQSIDSKIDGAIASYLSGINIAKQQQITSYYEKYKISGNADKTYDLVWSSVINKPSSAPYNARAGYSTYFDIPVNISTRLVSSMKSNSVGNVGNAMTNIAQWTSPVDTTKNAFIDTFIKENDQITQVVNILSTFNLLLTDVSLNQFTETTETAKGWKKDTTGFLHWNENYSRAVTLYPGGNNRGNILEEPVHVYDNGDAWNYVGWFRQTCWNDWSKADSSYQPILLPFANFTINCVIPGVSTATGYGYSHDTVVISKEQTAQNSATAGGKISNWWQKRHSYHMAAGLYVSQLNTQGFSLPTENPSDFIFKDFYQVDERNGKIKNGLVLCEIEKDGELEIKFTPTETGEVYFWQAKTSDDTWGGKKPSSTLPTNEQLGYDKNVTKDKVETRKLIVERDAGPVWVLYRPLGTTNEGKLNNFEITLTIED